MRTKKTFAHYETAAAPDPVICYLCEEPITREDAQERRFNSHHPEPDLQPDWETPVHLACHIQHHKRNGDYQYNGGLSSTSGRPGYNHTIARYGPGWHSEGGTERAKTARRGSNGRFLPGKKKRGR